MGQRLAIGCISIVGADKRANIRQRYIPGNFSAILEFV
jgi:hypothetical protein